MESKILDGKKLSKIIKKDIKKQIIKLNKKNIYPRLDVILVGSDHASKIYVKHKKKDCEEVGIISKIHFLDENIEEKELINLIQKLNTNAAVSGILVQLPLPKHICETNVVNTILPQKDVDGFTNVNIGKMVRGEKGLCSCTPSGIIQLLNYYDISLSFKNAVVLGRSNIVGKPLSIMLVNNDATVTTCHSKTKNIEEITKNADILLSAIGVPNFVTANMVKKGAIVVDVGINRDDNGKLVGDVNYEDVIDKVKFITPVPGGVGPMTRAVLLQNTLLTCINKR